MAKYEVTLIGKDGEEATETVEADSYATEVGLATFYKGGVGPVASFKAERVVTISGCQNHVRCVRSNRRVERTASGLRRAAAAQAPIR